MKYRNSLAFVASLALLAACGQRSDEAVEPEPEAAPAEAAAAAPVGMVMPATTSSAEALELYMKGWESFEVGRTVDAHKQFVAASEADPSFSMAHLMIWLLYHKAS